MPRPRKSLPPNPTQAIAYMCPSGLLGERQLYEIRQTCSRLDLTLGDEFTDDRAVPLPERNGFIDALIAVEAQRIGVVVTSSVAVLAATPSQHALAERAIERAGARWVQADPTTTWPRSSVDDAIAALRAHESMIYLPKVRLGLRRGPDVRPGGPPPWGYRRDEGGKFVEDPAEKAAVAEALRMRAAGALPSAIAAYLQGLALPNRSPRVYKSTVNAIFKRIDRGGK